MKYEYKNKTYAEAYYFDTMMMIGKIETNILVNASDGPFLRNIPNRAWIDSGDSSFINGHYYLARYVSKKLLFTSKEASDCFYQLYLGEGIYCRHPNPDAWTSEPTRFSRDQQKPVIAAESYDPDSWRRVLPFIARHFLLRLGLFDAKIKSNGKRGTWKFPTFTGPTVWASYLRYFINMWPKYFTWLGFLLEVLDVEIYLNHVVKATSQRNDTDVLNHVAYVIWFNKVRPTYFSKKALKEMDIQNYIERIYKYCDDGRWPYFVGEQWIEILNEIP